MSFKSIIGTYFNFSRKDRIAMITLISLITGVYFIPVLFTSKSVPLPVEDTALLVSIDSFYQENGTKEGPARPFAKYPQRSYNSPGKNPVTYFYFDPNTLDAGGWKKLGIRDKTIQTIQNYLSKGGTFHSPEDLQKVYGLFPDEFERIKPYIRIINTTNSNTDQRYPPRTTERISKKITAININAADSSAWISLPGIGNKLAARIIHFREKLGGFYSVSQVAETFGLPDSTFRNIEKYLITGNETIKKINLNTATLDELKSHPYIRYAIGSSIIAYRKEHGRFTSVEQLKNIMPVTDNIFLRISPYLLIN